MALASHGLLGARHHTAMVDGMRPLSEIAREADEFFMGQSPIHQAMLRLAQRLREAEIPFVVAGAMAVNSHGHKRTTADFDIILTQAGLEAFKALWLGRGWVERFKGSRGLLDAELQVPIDVLIAGDYPGDGKPRSISFPDPSDVEAVEVEGIPVLPLPTLIELKLASGITTTHRLKDLDDVMQLIRVNALGRDYAEQLDPFVQAAYLERWDAAQIEDDY